MKKTLLLVLAGASLAAAATTATRDLPGFYQPGGSITVTVSVVPQAGTIAVILDETLPADWTIAETAATPPYDKTEINGAQVTYSWLIFGDSPSSVSYTAQIPQGASGSHVFAGTVMTSAEGELTTGGDTIVQQGTGQGDINDDGSVTIADVILCLRMSIGLDTPDLATADLNSDGSVTIADVILLLRLSLGLS